MLTKTELHEAVLTWVRNLPAGRKFTYNDVYFFLEKTFPAKSLERGNGHRPQYRHDARVAVWKAMLQKYGGYIMHTGVPGQRERV